MINSFYPVIAGRTSDAQRRVRSLYQLQVDQVGLQNVQDQLSSGLRYSRASEDPSSAIRVIGLQSQREFNTQAITNLNASQSFLNITELNLSEAQNLLNEARGIGISSIDSTRTVTEREAFASQINSILERMVAVGNTKFQDRSLFAGGLVRDTPLVEYNSQVRFQGNDLDLRTASGVGQYVSHNVIGHSAFGVVSEGVTSDIDLNAGVTSTTRLSDLNGGFGVAPGAIQFTNGIDPQTIDVSNAETVQDVVDLINTISVDGRQITALLTPGGISINYADNAGGTLRIGDVGVGSSAADLGIATDTASPTLPISGNDLDPILRPTTRVSQFNLGAGMNLQGGLEIKQGDSTFRVELAQAQTVEDILNKINTSGAAVHADIAPGSRQIRVRSIESGTDFSIGESQGTLAARLGLRSTDGATALAELNYGRGIIDGAGADLTIERIDGTEIKVELQGAVTLADVIERINLHVDNQVPSQKIIAGLSVKGNGLTLSSPAGGTQPITIRVTGGSEAAWNLGLLPPGETERAATLVGGVYQIIGGNPNPLEVKGVFNSLVRLRDAIQNDNTGDITRAAQLLDEDINRLSTARGNLGVEQQRIDSLIRITEDQSIQLQSQESDEQDADLASVITELTARQAAQEASLRLLSQTGRMSLFDYL
jgi:flagellar hook-associated protein 3 FlgL